MELSTSLLADAGLTRMFPDSAERFPSVTLMVWFPAAFKVTGKVPVPLVRVTGPGIVAEVSDEVKVKLPG
jgi:hypothetical protein